MRSIIITFWRGSTRQEPSDLLRVLKKHHKSLRSLEITFAFHQAALDISQSGLVDLE
jgi:hypothetical protein